MSSSLESLEWTSSRWTGAILTSTAYDLDRVMGDGPAITRLIRSVPYQPYADVEFQTAYDDFDWEEGCDETH